VTERHIKRGNRGYGSNCPIALALRAARIKNPYVGTTDASWDDGECLLPKKAQAFVKRFDKEKPVKPFSFVVKILD
jgi:hypothetical protein